MKPSLTGVRYRASLQRMISELHARLTDPDCRHRTAERVVSLWDKRRARGAEPRKTETV
jgi:hypothetical protein